MRGKHLHIILVFLTFAVLSGCTKEVSQDDLIKAAVELKVEQWKQGEKTRCREKAVTDAEDYVDSLLLVTSLQTKLDTIPKPEKPNRPEKPEFKQKPDSVIVKRILEE